MSHGWMKPLWNMKKKNAWTDLRAAWLREIKTPFNIITVISRSLLTQIESTTIYIFYSIKLSPSDLGRQLAFVIKMILPNSASFHLFQLSPSHKARCILRTGSSNMSHPFQQLFSDILLEGTGLFLRAHLKSKQQLLLLCLCTVTDVAENRGNEWVDHIIMNVKALTSPNIASKKTASTHKSRFASVSRDCSGSFCRCSVDFCWLAQHLCVFSFLSFFNWTTFCSVHFTPAGVGRCCWMSTPKVSQQKHGIVTTWLKLFAYLSVVLMLWLLVHVVSCLTHTVIWQLHPRLSISEGTAATNHHIPAPLLPPFWFLISLQHFVSLKMQS